MRQAHNRRDVRCAEKEPHIDPNGLHETWIDIDLRDFYNQTFAQAVNDYNSRERHISRRIDNYYNTIANDAKKHLVYEMILQVGNKELAPDPYTARTILSEYVDDFKRNNPNMVIVGAYYHADEETPHLHLDVVPIAHMDRGMALQNSLSGALKEQGIEQGRFKNLTHAWQEQERDHLEQICVAHGLDIERGVCDRERRHLEQRDYKLQQSITHDLQTLDDLNALQIAHDLDIHDLHDFIDYKAQAQAQLDAQEQMLQDMQNNLNQQKIKLQQRKQALDVRERDLDAQEQEQNDLADTIANATYKTRLERILAAYPNIERQIAKNNTIERDIDR